MRYAVKRSKYGVDTSAKGIEDRTVDGICFHSKKEANRYCELRMLERSGIITGLKCQVPYKLVVNNVLITTLVVDFQYQSQDGREVCEDVKGAKTGAAYAMFSLKAKLLLAVHAIRVLET